MRISNRSLGLFVPGLREFVHATWPIPENPFFPGMAGLREFVPVFHRCYKTVEDIACRFYGRFVDITGYHVAKLQGQQSRNPNAVMFADGDSHAAEKIASASRQQHGPLVLCSAGGDK
jgi:hypothetical protein